LQRRWDEAVAKGMTSLSITVMTLNLHEGEQPSESSNSWEKRRDICVSVITSYSPTILCTQQDGDLMQLDVQLAWESCRLDETELDDGLSYVFISFPFPLLAKRYAAWTG